MANPTTTQTGSEPEKSGPGRKPGQPTRPSDVVAIEALEEGTGRLLWYLAANPASAFSILLARCARGGVERVRAEKALLMVEEAVANARIAFVAAYEKPVREEGVKAERPRVSL